MKRPPSYSQVDVAYFRSLAMQIHQRYPFFYLIVVATIAAAFLAYNWSWLVAIGVSSILISIIPCIVMCAFGLCMRGGKNCSKNSASTHEDGHD